MSRIRSPFQPSFLSLETVNYLVWFNAKHRFVYIETPKCGCTYVLSHLCSYVSGRDYFSCDIHRHRSALPLQKPLKDLASLNSYVNSILRNALVFTVVRDPLNRFLSGYSDKFLLNPDPLIWKSFGFSVNKSIPSPVQVITRAMAMRRQMLDIHFQPICDIIRPFRLDINRFVRIEELSTFLDDHFCYSGPRPASRNEALSTISAHSLISDKLIRKCKDFYRRDYLLLEACCT
jgi:hypothetical protein